MIDTTARIRGIVHQLRTATDAKARSTLCDQLAAEMDGYLKHCSEPYRLPLIALLDSIARRPSGNWYVTKPRDYNWALDTLDRIVT